MKKTDSLPPKKSKISWVRHWKARRPLGLKWEVRCKFWMSIISLRLLPSLVIAQEVPTAQFDYHTIRSEQSVAEGGERKWEGESLAIEGGRESKIWLILALNGVADLICFGTER